MSPQHTVEIRRTALRAACALLGPSLYWTWCLLVMTQPDTGLSSNDRPLPYILAILAVVLVAALASRFFIDRRHQLYLLASVPLAALNPMLQPLLSEGSSALPILGFGALAVPAIGFVGPMLMWGVWFTSLEPKQALEATSRSALLAVALFLVTVALPTPVVSTLAMIFPVLSGIAFIFAPSPEPARRADTPESQSWRVFVAKRLAFGFSVGLAQCFATPADSALLHSAGLRTIALTVGLATLLAAAMVSLRPGWFALDRRYLPGLPLLTSGLLLAPFLTLGAPALLSVVSSSAWLCWTIMSSAELCTYRIRFGIAAAPITFWEKVLVLTSSLVGFFIGSEAVALTMTAEDPIVTSVIVAVAYVFILTTSVSLLRRALQSDSSPTHSGSNANFDAQLVAACRRLSDEFGLTTREEQVLVLLAAGRDRPYIETSLHISTGTAKTHIRHIYDKIGVHERNDFLDLVHETMQSLNAT